MIIDIQRRLQEIGRIRIGQQVDTGKGKRPARLETFRLTSPDRARIENAARLYGGKVEAWTAPAGPQWEVITEADRLPVMVPPAAMAFSQFYELWSGGGCMRRCTGGLGPSAEQLSEGPCICAAEGGERQCEAHTRLSLFLQNMTGLGLWRLDSTGYYAAVELAGAVDIISQAAGHGVILPAILRLEQRVQRRPGEPTRRFAVPVLDIQITPAQLLGGGLNGQREITSSESYDAEAYDGEDPAEVAAPPRSSGTNVRPVPADSPQHWPVGSIAQQAGITEPPEDQPPPPGKSRRRKAQPIPPTGIEPRTREQAAADTRGEAPPAKRAPAKRSQSSADQPRDIPRGKGGARTPPRAQPRASADLSGSAAGTTLTSAEAEDLHLAREGEAREAAGGCRGHSETGSPCTLDYGHPMPCVYEDGTSGGWVVEGQQGAFDDEAQQAADAEAVEAEQAERGSVTISAHAAGPEPDLITPEQTTKLSIGLTEAGLGDHDKALAWINRNTRQNYTSRKQLTKDEASNLIDLLERDAERR